MVARLIKSSAKQVTQTLSSVGFEVEWRWVEVNRDNQRVKKRTRAYCISDSQTWTEIISRYYYSEVDEKPGDVPECLMSNKFHRVPGRVPTVPPVPEVVKNNGHGTLGTDNEEHSNNGRKPVSPCIVCGSKKWLKNNDRWICGICHPEFEGEILFQLDEATE